MLVSVSSVAYEPFLDLSFQRDPTLRGGRACFCMPAYMGCYLLHTRDRNSMMHLVVSTAATGRIAVRCILVVYRSISVPVVSAFVVTTLEE